MSAYLSPIGNEVQTDPNGVPLSGGKIYSYLAGTTSQAPTYTSSDGLTQQSNPIVLNSRGLPSNPIWIGAGVAVKLVVKDSSDVTIRTIDNVLGVNDPSGITAQDQWVSYSGTPSYISATSFSVAGDQTGTLEVNRRVKTSNSGGTVYSTITASSFSAGVTTVTVANDSGTLDSGLSAVSYGLLSYANSSVPKQSGELIGIQTFTSSGTYTPSSGTRFVVVEVQGGGGGSGGCLATAVGQWAAGRPGAGGGYGKKRITSGFSGVTVTVGAGGTAGAAGDNSGGAGGTSSFGALISCTGGAGGGGSGSVQTGAGYTLGILSSGGVATGADYSRPGSGPERPTIALSNSIVVTAAGGAAFFGPGGSGVGVTTNNGAGATPGGYGGGASGPTNVNGALAAQVGAAGAPGLVVVWEYA